MTTTDIESMHKALGELTDANRRLKNYAKNKHRAWRLAVSERRLTNEERRAWRFRALALSTLLSELLAQPCVVSECDCRSCVLLRAEVNTAVKTTGEWDAERRRLLHYGEAAAPIVEAAKAWRASRWNTEAGDEAKALSAAVDAFTAGPGGLGGTQ